MKSILSIWESPFMRELVKSKRVKVLKAKPPVAAQTIINPVQVVADTDDAESEDGFEVVKHPDSVNAVAYF
jgi:hypothetical protein